MKKPVFFITGPSGSGKTTIISFLRAILPSEKFDIRNFDEFGVPANVDKEWRFKTTEKWLQIAQDNSDKEISTVLCGITLPEEVSSLQPKQPVYFILLDADDQQIQERLTARYNTEGMQHDPIVMFDKDKFIKDSIIFAHHFRDVFKEPKENMLILHTDNGKPEETARELADWILAK